MSGDGTYKTMLLILLGDGMTELTLDYRVSYLRWRGMTNIYILCMYVRTNKWLV